MHEFSIAIALIDLAREHVPKGVRVRTVRVRVGPLQAIDNDAMQFAWAAVTEGSTLQGTELALEHLPWILNCLECGRRWRSENWTASCTCGSDNVDPTGGDELTLLSIDIDDETDDAGTRDPRAVTNQGAVS